MRLRCLATLPVLLNNKPPMLCTCATQLGCAQDISIDVYGRQSKEHAAAAVSSNAPSAAAAVDEEEADDMDALLSV